MMAPGDYDDDGQVLWTPNIHGTSGSASSLSSQAPTDSAVTRLRQVVAEITHGRIPAPPERGPRFYP